MRARRPPASPLYPRIRFACTDHPITGCAGAILLRLYWELIGLQASLRPLLVPFAKTSNNQIPAVDVLLAWWYGLALGAERFEVRRPADEVETVVVGTAHLIERLKPPSPRGVAGSLFGTWASCRKRASPMIDTVSCPRPWPILL